MWCASAHGSFIFFSVHFSTYYSGTSQSSVNLLLLLLPMFVCFCFFRSCVYSFTCFLSKSTSCECNQWFTSLYTPCNSLHEGVFLIVDFQSEIPASSKIFFTCSIILLNHRNNSAIMDCSRSLCPLRALRPC